MDGKASAPREYGGTDVVEEPLVWVCSACGKRARSRYGFDSENRSTAIDRGWDESCMLRAVLCEPAEPSSEPSAPKWRAVPWRAQEIQ